MSSPVPTWRGHVTPDGQLRVDDRPAFTGYLRRLAGQAVEIVVRRPKRVRSLPSNSYYWAAVLPAIAEETGDSVESVHDSLKIKFLSEENMVTGLTVVKSTATLEQDEFSRYVQDVKVWAHTFLGVYIPEPNEVES